MSLSFPIFLAKEEYQHMVYKPDQDAVFYPELSGCIT
jgi:hypothetical protein